MSKILDKTLSVTSNSAGACFDEIIHAPNRLQICALLVTTNEMEFKVLREYMEVSDSVLSKHIKTLETTEYVKVQKRTNHGRQRTWLSLTKQGVAAYEGHVQELKRILGN